MPEGLLSSQIGYDEGLSMRAAVCGTQDALGARPTFSLRSTEGDVVTEGELLPWGSKWGRDWWIIDFTKSAIEGNYVLEVFRGDGRPFRAASIAVGKARLWKQTFRHVALEQARKRAIFANAKVGWFDAGMHWQEANSHASFIIGLTDVLEFAPLHIDAAQRDLVELQIVNGCDYLKLCQDRSRELNNPPGSLVHEVPKWESIVLPQDAAKAVVALARASRLVRNHPDKARDYLRCARDGFNYLLSAHPLRSGFSRIARGLPDDFVVPEQWPTRDLFMQAWGALELSVAGLTQYKDEFAAITSVIAQRQIPRDKAEGKLFGHFYEFAGCGYSEKTWTHSLEDQQWGSDVGATFPSYIIPLIRACELWPEHSSAGEWRRTVQRYAYGYFQPACSANPFLIIPQGYFPEHGLLHFAGLWHGMNAAYGLAAAVAVELAHFIEDRSFLEIAVGNLQWIAGLNVGITRESLAGCVMFDTDIPENEALPASMIHGVGQRWAGGWTTMRGSICNGFATGQQFKFDVPPTLENDSKITLTDEDWITHCGGWLSGASRLLAVES